MINKIIYLFETKHLEKKDWEINGFQLMKDEGFEVEIWSTVEMRYRCKIKVPESILTEMTVKYIKSEKDFLENLSLLTKKYTIFLCYPSLGEDYCDAAKFIRKNIRLAGFLYCDYCYPGVPHKKFMNELIPQNFVQILIYYYKLFTNKSITAEEKRAEKEMLIFSILYPPTYNFIPSNIKLLQLANKFEILNKKTIMTHSFDYDLYLKRKKVSISQMKDLNFDEKFVVFIDSYMHAHSDYKKNGSRNILGEKVQKYFDEINYLFDYIESVYHCKVIIAAHPKAEYADNLLFNGRKLLYGKTDLLIKYSELVITTISTSLAINMLYKKKFIFYFNDEMKKDKTFRYEIEPFIKELEAKPLNISNKNDVENIEKYINVPNRIISIKYKDKYIKSSNSSDKLYFKIVADAIKKVN